MTPVMSLKGAPRGTERQCRSWQTEAAYRMLLNNLDPEVAENPSELIVYGGPGRQRAIKLAWRKFWKPSERLKMMKR